MNSRNKTTISYWLIAVFLFAALFFLTFAGYSARDARTTGPDIVVLGDSILGDCLDETSISAQLATLLQSEIYSGAMGGTGMGRADKEMRLGYTKDCLSFESIVKSIVAEDFGVQQSVQIRENYTDHFSGIIDGLEKVDFAQVDTLLVCYGMNDYQSGVTIQNDDDPLDPYTYTGALRGSIQLLRQKYPDLRIILVTPTYCWYLWAESDCEKEDFGGGLLEEYVNAELAVAQELQVEILDLYHDFYPHEIRDEWMLYTKDGVHPNEAGREKIANAIADYLCKAE